MKLVCLAIVSVLLSCLSLQASPRDPEGKARITKNEAEHIALKHFPGARVTAAKLEKVEGKLYWSLQIAESKGKPETKVEVDAMSGQITSLGAKQP